MLTMTYKGKRVLTTDQLATIFGTTTNSLKVNYHNNRARFKEGQHFYTIAGEELKAAKELLDGAAATTADQLSTLRLSEVPDAGLVIPAPTIGKFSKAVTLWTERGIMHHIKLINTCRAWALYDAIVLQTTRNVFDAILALERLPVDDKRKSVYVVALTDKVKIGVTSDIDKRLPQISTASGTEIVTYWCSSAIDAGAALAVEREAHECFSEQRLKGEFFDVSFGRACEAVKRLLSTELKAKVG